MTKYLCKVILMLGLIHTAGAQQADTTKKIFHHYVGVQANQLIKQLINLNSTNSTIDNPYLIKYSLFSAKYNWGIQTGFGFNYRKSKDKITAADQESKITEAFYRIGIGRKFTVGKKWEAGIGLDYIGSYELDKTFSFTVTNFSNQKDSTSSSSRSITETKGGGLRLELSYALSMNILLGTEMTCSYVTVSRKSHVMVTDTFTHFNAPEQNTVTLSTSNTETEDNLFSNELPVAIFLIIKF